MRRPSIPDPVFTSVYLPASLICTSRLWLLPTSLSLQPSLLCPCPCCPAQRPLTPLSTWVTLFPSFKTQPRHHLPNDTCSDPTPLHWQARPQSTNTQSWTVVRSWFWYDSYLEQKGKCEHFKDSVCLCGIHNDDLSLISCLTSGLAHNITSWWERQKK